MDGTYRLLERIQYGGSRWVEVADVAGNNCQTMLQYYNDGLTRCFGNATYRRGCNTGWRCTSMKGLGEHLVS